MVPTKRFWILVGLGIPLAAIAMAIGSPSVAVVYDLVLVIAAYISYRLGPDAKALTVRRTYDPVLSVRAWNRVRFTIANDGPEDIALDIRDEPPGSFMVDKQEFSVGVQAGRDRELVYNVRPVERGGEKFRGTAVRIHCPFGLAYRQEWIDSSEDVRVYPNILALKEFDLLRQQGRLKEIGIRRSRARGLGMEFESLRQYTEGDDFRKIDWKASARKGEIVVRQFEQERNQAVIICIDTGRHMLSEVNGVTKLDHVLDSLLMLANAATIAGDLVGLVVFSDTVRRFLPPRKGRNQLGMVIEACHDLVAEAVESDLGGAMAYLSQHWKRRCLLVVFSDCEDPDRAKDLSLMLSPVVRRHLTLLCRIQDGRLDEVEGASVADLRSMYDKAAARMLLADRKQAYSQLTVSGVQVLDSEPQDLATKLVNFYFTAKERSLL